MISKTIHKCRLCGSNNLDDILDLGDQPPANSLRQNVDENLENVPLVLCRCRDCTTVQLTEDVDPAYMFSNYVWVTGTSKGAREYSRTFYDRINSKVNSDTSLFAVEIASNDGTFLRQFKEGGYRVLGIDPAKNLAEQARVSGVPTLADFFSRELSEDLVAEHGKADVVFARNVIPHVPDPNDVVSGIEYCLADNGVGVIEFHWVGKIIDELHYDSIYHEHFFYHSINSINALLNRHGLYIFDIDESPISGGSLVVYFSKLCREPSDQLQQKIKYEEARGYASLEAWSAFAERSIQHAKKFRSLIEGYLSKGKSLIGYGASARSSTLLNFCGIDDKYLDCISDQNSLKHGRYTPGTNILILPPEKALEKNPDVIVILAWNFKDEIIEDLSNKGFRGDILVPLPGEPTSLSI